MQVLSIILAMLLGVVVGHVSGSSAAPLGVFGTVFIQLIKAFAVPLVFLSIVDAIISSRIQIKHTGHLLLILFVNSCCAALIGLALSNIIDPGTHLRDVLSSPDTSSQSELFTPKSLSLDQFVKAWIPVSIIAPLSDNNVLAMVLIALLFGIALRRATSEVPEDRAGASKVIALLLKSWTILLGFLTAMVPLAVFAVTAKTVGEHGIVPLVSLSWYVGTAIAGLLVHMLLVYPLWIRFVAGFSLKDFVRAARAPVSIAFGTNSSLVTLPTTLKALDSLKVNKASSRLGACVATNFNNDGILLYEAMAVLFVAQVYGIDLSLTQQILAIGLSVLAAAGVAGIPEAGVVSLSLVLAAVGLPLELLPLLLTVDWIVARFRSVVNVLADMTVSSALHGMSRSES